MSKELEALKRIVSNINDYKIHGFGDENWLGLKDVLDDIDIIEKAITKPTVEEVCEELSEWFGENIYYTNKSFHNKAEESNIGEKVIICKLLKHGVIDFNCALEPYQVAMIGRFYEGTIK